MGYGSEIVNTNNSIAQYRMNTLDLRLFKIGPQYFIPLSNNVSIDLSLDISPTAMFLWNNITGKDYAYRYYGLFIGPNIRVKYQILTIGAELAYGKLYSNFLDKSVNNYGRSLPNYFIYPRIYLGVQF